MKKIYCAFMMLVLTVNMCIYVDAADIQEIEEYAYELENLIEVCKESGLDPVYEINYTNIIKNYAAIIEKYENDGLDGDIIGYQRNCIDDLYAETKVALESYINGEKKPLNTKKDSAWDININGKSLVDSNGTPKTSLGMVYPEVDKIEVLKEMGYDNIQCDISAEYMLLKGSKVDNWNINSEDCCYLSEDAKRGECSLELKNLSSGKNIQVSQYIPVLPGREYNLSYYIKGSLKGGAKIVLTNQSSSVLKEITLTADVDGWKKNEISFTTGEEDYMCQILIEAKNINSFCIDEFSVIEKDSRRECIINGGFEGDGNEIVDSGHRIENTMYLQKVISNSDKSDMGVCLLLLPYNMPQWLVDEYPEIKGENPYYKVYNLDSEIVRDAVELFLRTIADQVKNYPEITSVCLSNEPCYDTAAFKDTYNPKFRQYLLLKHGSIDKLNEKYGSSYTSFEDIEIPDTVERTPLFYDWSDFNNKTFADFHKWMADIIKEYLPNTPVHSKIMSIMDTGDFNDMLWIMRRGNNPEYFDEFSDMTGCDSWAIINSTGLENNLKWYDFLNSVTDKPIYDSEMHLTSDRDNNFSENYKTQFEGYLWQAAVHGVDMSSIWLWSQSVDETSSVYGHVAMRPDCAATVSKSALDQNRLSDEIRKLSNAAPDTAILYSEASRVYSRVYMGVMDRAYLGALYAGRKIGFVTENCMEKLNNYKTLIITDAKNVKFSTLQKIKEFSDNGGEIVILGDEDTIELDEYNRPHNSSITDDIKLNAVIVDYQKDVLYPEILSKPSIYEFAGYLVKNEDVSVINSENGSRTDEIEWQVVEEDNQILVNIFNHSRTEEKHISVLNKGNVVETSENLITMDTEESVISLLPRSAKLIRIKKPKLPQKEIQTISGLRNGTENIVRWTATGTDNMYFVYEIRSDGEQKFITKTDEVCYSEESDFPKTYRVKVLRNDGMSFGKTVTCGNSAIVSDNFFEKNGNYITGTMDIFNNSKYAVFGIFKMIVKDKYGNTISSCVSERLITAGRSSVLNAEFPEGETIEFIIE